MEFDAFLSHNSRDKAQVKIVAEALKKNRIRVWLDEWELIPGRPWQEGITAGLQQSKTVVVLIGPAGVGRWEEPEIRVALDQSLHRNIPVIPVLLPGVSRTEVEDRPFLRQHTWVEFKDGLEDADTLRRLIWGITGRNPYIDSAAAAPSESVPAPKLDPLNEAVKYLADRSRSTNITFVLGRNFLDSGTSGSIPAMLSRELLASLDLIGSDYNHLVPPLDQSASYYAARWDEFQLQSTVADLLMQQKVEVPAVYEALARLLVVLNDRSERRTRSPVEQLIVSTNIDTWLERALIRAGISFSRVVHFRSRRRLLVTQYRNLSVSERGLVRVESSTGEVVAVDGNNLEELDDIIRHQDEHIYDADEAGFDSSPSSSLIFSKLQQPILYKLLGSHDVLLSCAISADQHYDLAWQVSRFNSIPPKVGEIISNSPVVFLGCGIFESDFRVGYHTLLRNAFVIKGHKRYALWPSAQLDPHDVAHKMGTTSWESLRNAALSAYGIELLDGTAAPFIDAIREAIAKLRAAR